MRYFVMMVECRRLGWYKEWGEQVENVMVRFMLCWWKENKLKIIKKLIRKHKKWRKQILRNTNIIHITLCFFNNIVKFQSISLLNHYINNSLIMITLIKIRILILIHKLISNKNHNNNNSNKNKKLKQKERKLN